MRGVDFFFDDLRVAFDRRKKAVFFFVAVFFFDFLDLLFAMLNYSIKSNLIS